MPDLSAYPIARRWPAKHPDRLQLYSFPTPNGVKVSIALEEIGLPYEAHAVDITKNDLWTPEFLALNPNGKIPAIVDPDGPGGKPLGLFELGAILLYLAEKTGALIPADPARRYETIEWVFFQMAAIGPIFGQVGYFYKFAGTRDRGQAAARALPRRIPAPARRHREAPRGARNGSWATNIRIADIAMFGWIRGLIGFYGAREIVKFDDLERVPAWLDRGLARPAVQRGLDIPKRG